MASGSAQILIEQHSHFRWLKAKAWKQALAMTDMTLNCLQPKLQPKW